MLLIRFPFATSLSDYSELTQIQSGTDISNLVWNTFRKIIWRDSNREHYEYCLKEIRSQVCDDALIDLGMVVTACFSDKFIPK